MQSPTKKTKQTSSNFTSFDFKCEVTALQKKEVLNFFRSNTISCLTGDPGTGKTFTAVYHALKELDNRACEKIIITKPLTEVTRSMGYLPGTKAEKIADYMRSYEHIFEKILGIQVFNSLMNAKKIIFEPVNFCRGNTFEYAHVILDESQNLTLHELLSFTTRIADTSKLIMIGDDWQSDIKESGFKIFLKLFSKVEGIGYIHLGEEFQMRNSLITEMYKIYKEYLTTKNI